MIMIYIKDIDGNKKKKYCFQNRTSYGDPDYSSTYTVVAESKQEALRALKNYCNETYGEKGKAVFAEYGRNDKYNPALF